MKYSLTNLKDCNLGSLGQDSLVALNQKLHLWIANGVAMLTAMGDAKTSQPRLTLNEDDLLNGRATVLICGQIQQANDIGARLVACGAVVPQFEFAVDDGQTKTAQSGAEASSTASAGGGKSGSPDAKTISAADGGWEPWRGRMAASTNEPKLTMTEQILKAKNVNSLADLRKKHIRENPDKGD